MKMRLNGVAFVLALTAFLTMPAQATTMKKMNEAEMATAASTIVLGHCRSATSQWVGGTLMTSVTVEVSETLKGAAANEITLVIPGGIDASRAVPVAVTFPGAPTVFQNEEVLLFLSDSAAIQGAHEVVGFAQGKFTVVETSTGKKVAAQGSFKGNNGKALGVMKNEIRKALED